MHLSHLPRFHHIHPALGGLDVIVAVLMIGTATSPVERFNALVGELISSAMQVGLLVTGLTLLALKMIDSGRKIRAAVAGAEVAVAGVTSNADEIAAMKRAHDADRAEAEAKIASANAAAKLADTKAVAAHAAAHRVALESEAKADAAAKAAAKAAAAEIDDLKRQIRNLRHMTRDVANEVAIERQVRERFMTPDPDKSGTFPVVTDPDLISGNDRPTLTPAPNPEPPPP